MVNLKPTWERNFFFRLGLDPEPQRIPLRQSQAPITLMNVKVKLWPEIIRSLILFPLNSSLYITLVRKAGILGVSQSVQFC